ncbi:MAG: hypothetical protein EOP07_00150 [Proteobacteria bacterium]|nr:MAG: hypothetical protein EOP07_00150 [Pseudomonadota bacterium]
MSLYQTSNLRLALLRALPKSFANALQQHPSPIPIDVSKAHIQHEYYSSVVRENVDYAIDVDVDEKHPDCCFIEDTAIIVGRDVIITRIGAESRREESRAVAKVLSDDSLKDFEFRMHQLVAPACLDGGDVLQLGDKVFVGLSLRTNLAAIEQLEKILPGRIKTIPVGGGLHLKSVLSAIDDTTLLAADSRVARQMAEEIISALEGKAQIFYVPDVVAANVVRLGPKLLIQAGYPNSEKILRKAALDRQMEVITLDMSELVKADGALSCCSLLVP